MFLDNTGHDGDSDRYISTAIPDEQIATEKNSAYELKKFGAQPDTTARHPVYANVNF